jgi:N-acetylglutamate synthase
VIVAENLDEAGIRAIEERAFNAWPALRTVIAQGWIFRFSEGFTRRANSVNALAPVGPFEDTLRMAEALYAKQGLPVVFHLSPLAGSDVDGVLERAGYRRVDETLVQTLSFAERGDGGGSIWAGGGRARHGRAV